MVDDFSISGRKSVYASQNGSQVSQYLRAVQKVGTAENPRSRHFTLQTKTPVSPNRLASDKRVPGDVQVFHPKLPGALCHLARYDAVPQETVEYVYRKAIRQLLDRAASDANAVFGVGTQNKIFSNESFGDLLATTGMFETYHGPGNGFAMRNSGNPRFDESVLRRRRCDERRARDGSRAY